MLTNDIQSARQLSAELRKLAQREAQPGKMVVLEMVDKRLTHIFEATLDVYDKMLEVAASRDPLHYVDIDAPRKLSKRLDDLLYDLDGKLRPDF